MKWIFCLVFICFSSGLLAAEHTLTCDAPQGIRVDYFSSNAINLQNETFLMGRDRVSGMRPKIILSEDNGHEVTFVIGDAAESKAGTKSGTMKVLMYTADQISFAGMINGAPIMGSYYPKMGILIYSQQSIWPGPDYTGARAVIFYSRCK